MVKENGMPLSKDIKVGNGEKGNIELSIGSGKYHFEIPK